MIKHRQGESAHRSILGDKYPFVLLSWSSTGTEGSLTQEAELALQPAVVAAA